MGDLKIYWNPATNFCPLVHAYNKRFQTYVSQGIKPASYRRFNGEDKRWDVHVAKIPQLVAAAKRWFSRVDYRPLPPEVQIKIVQFQEKNPDPVRITTPKTPPPHAVLFVTRNAPPEVIKAAYKALAQKHHPDHGGDPEEFRKIDEAYKRLTNG
jgi:hypothetical protein